MAEQDVFPDSSETFNFLAFPLEIRDIIYDNLYVEDESQVAPFTPMISVFNFPNLSCSTTSSESLSDCNKNLVLSITAQPECFDSAYVVRLQATCTSGSILDSVQSEDIVRAAIGYVYELRKERKPISNPSLQVSFQCSIRYPVRRYIDDINFSISVEALQLHSIEGSSKGVIRQDIEGALASYQNALDDPECVYKPFCPFGTCGVPSMHGSHL
ncbi:hypothetical protein OEA41_006884 [Lepraria neglecta]|uniref:Uncharacterized protein n=1 Tax=Lepraria neglecta TaxID=209136 RepID=A0AAD9Z9M2_9LECA|nr:hypothetical protein OEA41_006884 [Lepraria neglecta]